MRQKYWLDRILRLACRRLLPCLVLLFLPPEAHAQIAITDDLGQEVRLEHPAKRIIALYGAFNEILAAMHLENRIAARTNADVLPPGITALPSIGTHMRPNVEQIVGIAPDVVLQMGGREEAAQSVEDLKRFGVTAALFQISDFEGLFKTIQRIGILTATPDQAQKMIETMQARLNYVQERIPLNTSCPSVVFEVRSHNLLVAGQQSIITDIVHRAGGRNCVLLDKKLVRLNEEELLRLAPDTYLAQQGHMNPEPLAIFKHSGFEALPAKRNNRIFIVDEQMFSRPGPRNVDAVELLAGILYPDVFPEFAAQAVHGVK